MIHPTPTKVLLATTLQPLVVQLSGSLARGAKLIDQFLHHAPTPQGTGSVSCNSAFVLHLRRFLNQEELMERKAMV